MPEDEGELKDLQKSPGSNEIMSMAAIKNRKVNKRGIMHSLTSPAGFFDLKFIVLLNMAACVADR